MILSNAGNDYLDFEESKKIISKLPKPRHYQHSNERMNQIHTVFAWLATQSSAKSVLDYLTRMCSTSKHRLIQVIERRYIDASRAVPTVANLSSDEYYEQNRELIF